ncbi:HTH domain-containing protein [Erysipelothrix urinaevulpis]|uniref:BglG family transcription antiterminator n=1 Tax=Erysipelothrix urinaevulpis TaxID=2683717 RepID=UPI00135C1DB5|nr:HTH domain-containing protein [Erysipelothrix urinaevulpis]
MNTRRRKLLEILLNTNIWMNGPSLAEIFKVSDRTIRTDIKEINLKLEAFDVKIDSESRKGYFINPAAKEKLLKHIKVMSEEDEVGLPQTPSERENYILYRLLYEDEYISTETLAHELFVSKGTAYLDLKRVESKIEGLGQCQLIIDSGIGIKLEGSEQSKRVMIYNTIKQINKYKLTFNSAFLFERKLKPQKAEEELILIYEMLKRELNYYECVMVDKDMISFSKEIFISLLRIDAGYEIIDYPQGPRLLMNIINDLCNRIEMSFEIMLNTNERTFIQNCFNSKRLLEIGTAFSLATSKEQDIFDRFIHIVFEEYELNLNESDNFEAKLLTHLGPLMVRVQSSQMEHSDVPEQIKKKYPFAYVISTKIIPIIYEQTEVIISETELAYISLHVAVALDDLFVKKDMLIVCGSGFATARLIKKELQSKLSPHLNEVNIMPYSEFVVLDHHEIKEEIIVSSVPFSQEIKGKATVLVNPILTPQDLKNVEKVVENFGTIDNNKKEKIETYFPRELYMRRNAPSSYLELIDTMVLNLHKQGYIEDPKAFYNSVIERENTFSTVLDNGISIPHPMMSMSKQSVVSIAVIPEGLKVKDKTVFMILLFSVNSKEVNKLTVMYEYLEYLAELNYTKPLSVELLNYDTLVDFLSRKDETS